MDSFVYNGFPSKVHFGQGKLDTLPDVIQTMQLERCIVLTTPNQQRLGQRVADLLGPKAVAIFNKATMHTPLDITEEAIKVAKEARVDSTVSIGGGSTTGLGKAIAFRLGLRQICIPTTYAGSEMTPTLGEAVNGRKTTRRDEAIRPDVVIYDVDLTLKLPVETSSASGINAIAHAGKCVQCRGTLPHYAKESHSRKSVFERHESHYPHLCLRRYPQPRNSAVRDQGGPGVNFGTTESAIRRMALCYLPWEYHNGSSS